MDNDRLKYFDCMKLAREEFRIMTEQYPEMINLSARELEIFEWLLSDKTLNQIAEELCISSSAVHFHCKNIYKKLNVSSRRQFLIKYRRLAY